MLRRYKQNNHPGLTTPGQPSQHTIIVQAFPRVVQPPCRACHQPAEPRGCGVRMSPRPNDAHGMFQQEAATPYRVTDNSVPTSSAADPALLFTSPTTGDNTHTYILPRSLLLSQPTQSTYRILSLVVTANLYKACTPLKPISHHRHPPPAQASPLTCLPASPLAASRCLHHHQLGSRHSPLPCQLFSPRFTGRSLTPLSISLREAAVSMDLQASLNGG